MLHALYRFSRRYSRVNKAGVRNWWRSYAASLGALMRLMSDRGYGEVETLRPRARSVNTAVIRLANADSNALETCFLGSRVSFQGSSRFEGRRGGAIDSVSLRNLYDLWLWFRIMCIHVFIMLVEFTKLSCQDWFCSLSYKFQCYTREYRWNLCRPRVDCLAIDNTFVAHIFQKLFILRIYERIIIKEYFRIRGGKGIWDWSNESYDRYKLPWSVSIEGVRNHLPVSCETISWKPAKEFLRFTSRASECSVIPFHLTVPMRMPVNGEWRRRKKERKVSPKESKIGRLALCFFLYSRFFVDMQGCVTV